MVRTGLAAGAMMGALLGCAFVLGAPALAQPQRGDRVSIAGCPFAGITANCLMIRHADGTIYNITSASPRPRVGARMIRLRGTVTDKVSICGQGIVLERIRWTRSRQRCPK